MRLHYYPDIDSFYIELKPEPGDETDGLNVDVDERGDVVGFYLDFASKRFDITEFEAIARPLSKSVAV